MEAIYVIYFIIEAAESAIPTIVQYISQYSIN